MLGAFVFGTGDESIASAVLAALKARQATLAVAESCTGGLICSAFTAVPGASEVLLGGATTYRDTTKTLWAQVSPHLIQKHGAVSEAVARAMATGIRRATGATWGLAVTGYAGPGGGNQENPVGAVYVGVSTAELEQAERHTFFGDRDRVRAFAASTAIDFLRRTL